MSWFRPAKKGDKMGLFGKRENGFFSRRQREYIEDIVASDISLQKVLEGDLKEDVGLLEKRLKALYEQDSSQDGIFDAEGKRYEILVGGGDERETRIKSMRECICNWAGSISGYGVSWDARNYHTNPEELSPEERKVYDASRKLSNTLIPKSLRKQYIKDIENDFKRLNQVVERDKDTRGRINHEIREPLMDVLANYKDVTAAQREVSNRLGSELQRLNDHLRSQDTGFSLGGRHYKDGCDVNDFIADYISKEKMLNQEKDYFSKR